MKIVPLNIEGLSADDNWLIESRMQKILDSWEGTPHMDGQQAKGMGVDCVRFVAAVLDELIGTKTPIKHLPSDTAFHQRDKAVAGMRLFIKQFDGYRIGPDEPLQAGDVLVTGPRSGGPGHAMIVGPDGFIWQSAYKKVIKSGLESMSVTVYKHKATMRVRNRERWNV
ncbi:MAG: hypothetical protein D4S01_04415 [Dehalococcoidia bacterium]|nr:MAG: hypothetical protein D4S01_04415 [Dehalococcoidia bacterium]